MATLVSRIWFVGVVIFIDMVVSGYIIVPTQRENKQGGEKGEVYFYRHAHLTRVVYTLEPTKKMTCRRVGALVETLSFPYNLGFSSFGRTEMVARLSIVHYA